MAKKNAALKTNDSTRSVRSRFAQQLGFSHNGRRDLYEVFGYPRELQVADFHNMYLRNDVANRIIRAFPQATWRDLPLIRDEAGESSEEGTDTYSPFVHAVEDFFDKHKLIRQIERADRLSGIGRYGLLFLGFNDGRPPSAPLQEGSWPLMYTQAYSELGVTVAKWETEPSSPRFGLPVAYNLSQAAGAQIGEGGPVKSFVVHHSRVIHVAEFLDQDDIYGVPRLMPIYNRLKDMEKVVGGAAETFWLAADRGIALWADADAEYDADDVKAMKEQAEEFQDKLRRYLIGKGMTAQVLGSESPDPEPNAAVLMDLIAGTAGIPKRILLGTERGELASSQDENNWASRIDERRRSFGTPTILQPLIDLLIKTGNLPMPEGSWWVEWDDTSHQDPNIEADIAVKRTSALTAYANSPDARLIVPEPEFRRDIMGLPPESEYAVPLPEDLPEDELTELPQGEQPLTEDPLSTSPDDEEVDPSANIVANAEPKSLYVWREVLNRTALEAWAKEQGLELQPDLHVTVMYSPEAVDWMKMGQTPSTYPENEESTNLMIHPGGPRVISEFSANSFKGKAVVLEFTSDILHWRHRHMVEMGASPTHMEYKPHITLFYDESGAFEIDKIKPYQGAIALGPEIFEEIAG